MKEITAAALLSRKNKGDQFLFIDVREVWEFEEESIADQCCPLGELPQFLDKLNAYKNQEIILHCNSGDRSKKAQKYLTQQGFKKVYSLTGGIEAFRQLV